MEKLGPDPITNIATRASYEDAEYFMDVLEMMCLPEPTRSSFYYGNEADFVFLDRLGLAIRVGYQESKDGADVVLPAEHDLVIAPWKQIHLSRSTLELLPLVDIGQNRHEVERDLTFLGDELSKAGQDFWDTSKHDNIGYLPVFKDRFSQGLPVVIDRGAVKATEACRTAPLTPAFSQATFYTGVQEALYRPLTDRLERAWPEDTDIRDVCRPMLLDFCSACKDNRGLGEEHPEKRLFGLKYISGYGSPRNRSIEALQAGIGYESTLQEMNTCYR